MNGRASQRRRKPYSRESIAHALAHHTDRGAVMFFLPPEPGRPEWRVGLPHVSSGDRAGYVDFTESQAYALCLGLAAGETHEQNELARLTESDRR